MYTGNLPNEGSRLGAWSDSLLVDHAVFRVLWDNWAEVVPGKLYRSNHPTPARLAAAARRYHLKTLINLRGHRQCGSDALSREAAWRLGLAHIDMAFESRGAPHRDRVLRFARIYADLQAPALMHCKSGADRAGLACWPGDPAGRRHGGRRRWPSSPGASAISPARARGYWMRSLPFTRATRRGVFRFCNGLNMNMTKPVCATRFAASGISSFLSWIRVLQSENREGLLS